MEQELGAHLVGEDRGCSRRGEFGDSCSDPRDPSDVARSNNVWAFGLCRGLGQALDPSLGFLLDIRLLGNQRPALVAERPLRITPE